MVDDIKVVIKIHEVFSKALYAMHITLDDDRVEGREELVGNEILMTNEVYAGIAEIEPLGYLARSDQMNGAYPGSKLLYPAKPIFQESVVTEAGFGYTILGVILVSGVL